MPAFPEQHPEWMAIETDKLDNILRGYVLNHISYLLKSKKKEGRGPFSLQKDVQICESGLSKVAGQEDQKHLEHIRSRELVQLMWKQFIPSLRLPISQILYRLETINRLEKLSTD